MGAGENFDFDLGTMEFWRQDARTRDEAFRRLRDEHPVSHHHATEDRSVSASVTCPATGRSHGQQIREGEKVVPFYQSANRDHRVFEDRWRFDVAREPNRHAGFGGGGPHYCLGAPLARTQLVSIFSELLTRIPDVEVEEPEMFDSGAFINGVKRMECRFTPSA